MPKKLTHEKIIEKLRDDEQYYGDFGRQYISNSDIKAQFAAVELDIAMGNLRTKRNKLLAETDYLALSDNTLSDDMKTYRQNLRDLPAGKDTVEKCENATWPTKP